MTGRVHGRVEQHVLPRQRAAELERLEGLREVVEDPEVEHDVEGPAQRLAAHLPEVEDPEVDVLDADDGLHVARLLDELRARVEAHDLLGAEEGALERPEPGVAGDVEHAPAAEVPSGGLQEPRHEVAKPLERPVGPRRLALAVAEVQAESGAPGW